MGIDLNLLKLLIVVRSRLDRPLGRSLTIGRQQIHFQDNELAAAWHSMRCPALPAATGIAYGTYCEALLALLGATSVDSMDASDYEGATIVHDLNQPLPDSLSNSFDTVIDFGTMEHVFNVPQVLKTYASLVRRGGLVVIATQADGSCGHGFYQFSPELFYRFFSSDAGFDTKCFLLPCGSSRRRWIFSPDPASSRSRIEFPTMGKTYVVALTQRQQEGALLTCIQQSDYTALWDSNPVTFYTRLRTSWLGGLMTVLGPLLRLAKKRVRDTAAGHALERWLTLRMLPISRFRPEDFPRYESLRV